MNVPMGQITLLYNSDLKLDRETYSYATSLKDHKLLAIDLTKDKLTRRQLAEIADDLKGEIQDLLDKNSQEYQSNLKDAEMDDHDLLTMMMEQPNLIRTPIFLVDGKIEDIGSAKDLIKKDFEWKKIDDY